MFSLFYFPTSPYCHHQPDSSSSICDNFYCRVPFSLFERKHVRRSVTFYNLSHLISSPIYSIVANVAASFAVHAHLAQLPFLTPPISQSSNRREICPSPPSSLPSLLSLILESVTIVGTKYTVVQPLHILPTSFAHLSNVSCPIPSLCLNSLSLRTLPHPPRALPLLQS